MNISFKQITKCFGEVRALEKINLEIADGELFFLLGPSGCGKTTLLRCLGGFENPTSGSIQLDGREVTGIPPHKRDTAMVFQGYALWPHMTVEQNVSFGLENQKVPPKERRERVWRALESTRITELAKRKPNELSGGQQQRVALARTLVVEPGCLLLDEPLANLDAKLRREMRSEIRRICKENGLTAVYVTHDRHEALGMADRLAVLKDGNILQCGTPGEVYRRPLNAFVASFIGETNLIPGTVLEGNLVKTPLGNLVYTGDDMPKYSSGSEVLVSLRPEAFGFGSAEKNTFSAIVRENTYLGEIAQSCVIFGEDLSLQITTLNPHTISPPGSAVQVFVSPEDVVLLPAK